jgi:YVTN family beta-propeller protein
VGSWSGDRVYVLNKGDETVSAIDTRTRSVVASVAVGHAPVDMALDPSGIRLYVANQVSQSLTVIDTARLEPVATIQLTTLSRRTGVGLFRDPVSPQPWAVGVSRDGKRLLVAFWEAGTLALFDAHTGAHLAETQLDNARYSIGPNAIAADWSHGRLYVSCADHALVTVHDD